MIHHKDAPWFPSMDSKVNELLSEDLLKTINDYIKENDITVLPEQYSIQLLSLKDDRSKIRDFISKFFGTDKWRVEIDDHEFDYMNDSNNAYFLGFMWKGLLVGMVSIEIFNGLFNGRQYTICYGDHLMIHPKFRSTGLCNIIITNAIIEATKRGCQFVVFTTHSSLNAKSVMVKRLYNLALSETPRVTLDQTLNKYKPLPIKTHTIIEPTIEHVKRFNEMDYKLRFIYNEEQLNAMLKHGLIYTDGTTVLRFNTITNVCDGFRIKTAILQDYINANHIGFFNEALSDLQSKGFDMVTILNDRTIDPIINKFGFKKNSEMNIYTINLLPKLKPNEVHINVR